ncbi:tetratricopeptide repeat protein [Shimia sagamensis]|uniref:Tetratricopeptide repeat-containing protein n=1 Tax=Shimia sagamensis TaxID=1566352 RepID=A0ABY1P6X5_9RHOB|nr:tetratricopeptide repeat protein [Shimia sagamensis]SMP26287.1 Tetratricopeptide repeat-containing protein [Shimia sagamensis]
MRHPVLGTICVAGLVALTACADKSDESVERAIQDVNAVDEANLSDVMLTVADPNEGIAYFHRTLKDNPNRIDLQRGLAVSYVRAKRFTEAVPAWKQVIKHKDSTANDRVDMADAQIRAGMWDDAEKTLDGIPPTHETFKRYRLEAMIADSNKEWNRADSFYEIAVSLTTRPAGVMNNWGYSKLTRGDYADAERLFGEAVRQDSTLFTAKNNMVLARGAQRQYTLPVIPMVQTERAQLLHTLALSAIKQGDTETGKVLLREAVETHPQHFEAAVRALDALESS